jgi:riboflavin synthase alpha subunit
VLSVTLNVARFPVAIHCGLATSLLSIHSSRARVERSSLAGASLGHIVHGKILYWTEILAVVQITDDKSMHDVLCDELSQ